MAIKDFGLSIRHCTTCEVLETNAGPTAIAKVQARTARSHSVRTTGLRLDHLFLAVFASKAKYAGFIAGLENGIRVFRPTGTGNTETRYLLRCTDLDRRAPAFRDQAQQDRFALNDAVLRRAGRQNADARADATLLINYLQTSTSQNRRVALGASQTEALGKQCDKKEEVDGSERQQELRALHVTPPNVD